MKSVSLILAAIGILSASPAYSATFTLDFEGATSFSSIHDFYNGGTDASGASGTNHGVSFSAPGLALSNDGLGNGTPDGRYYSNAPTNGAVLFAFDAPTVANVAVGILGSVDFYYSAKSNLPSTTTVSIFSGLDGSGTLLKTMTLAANADADEVFDTWSKASLAFSGTGHSISFGNNGGFVAYDNITISAVPEPSGALLLALGVGVLGLSARRQKQA